MVKESMMQFNIIFIVNLHNNHIFLQQAVRGSINWQRKHSRYGLTWSFSEHLLLFDCPGNAIFDFNGYRHSLWITVSKSKLQLTIITLVSNIGFSITPGDAFVPLTCAYHTPHFNSAYSYNTDAHTKWLQCETVSYRNEQLYNLPIHKQLVAYCALFSTLLSEVWWRSLSRGDSETRTLGSRPEGDQALLYADTMLCPRGRPFSGKAILLV